MNFSKTSVAKIKKVIMEESGTLKRSQPYWMNERVLKSAKRCVQSVNSTPSVSDKKKESLNNWISNLENEYL